MIAGYGLILASSVGERDGMALELTKVDGERVAEVFQDSVDGARTFTVFGEQQVPIVFARKCPLRVRLVGTAPGAVRAWRRCVVVRAIPQHRIS